MRDVCAAGAIEHSAVDGPVPKYRAGDRVVPQLDVIEGDIVRYGGRRWMAKVKRGNTIPLFPLERGRPQVSADTLLRVDVVEHDVRHTGTNFYGYGGQPKPAVRKSRAPTVPA